MTSIRLLLVMSHPGVRVCFQQSLEQSGNIDVVGAVGTGLAAMETARRLLPDVVFIDFHLPDIHGLEATSNLIRELPSIQVIVLGDEDGEAYREAALACGAKAYLPKWVASGKLQGTLLSLGSVNHLQPAGERVHDRKLVARAGPRPAGPWPHQSDLRESPARVRRPGPGAV